MIGAFRWPLKSATKIVSLRMRASQNELKSLFKQAFEACAYDFGRYEVAAELVVWSQMLGFNIFPMVKDCLLPLTQDSLSVTLLLDQPKKLIFDNQGHSILVSASQIVNLACVKALSHGFCEVQVQNCAHPVLIAKLLCDIKNYGLHTKAYWYRAQTEQALELRTDPKQNFPELLYYSKTGGFSNASGLNDGELNMIFAKQENLGVFADRNSVFNNRQLDKRLRSEYFATQYQQSLDQGIEIETNLWQQLLKLGSEVLVESNEHSRQGAGS